MRPLAEYVTDPYVPDLSLLLSVLRNEDEIDRQVSAQLHQELQRYIKSESQGVLHEGVKRSPLYTKIPIEIRHQIFSYIVQVPESVHVFPVKGNTRLGFRLSRCPDTFINGDSGTCNCESSFRPPTVPPIYFDTELLLVSKTTRREVLDLTFMCNSFTFTSLRDLANFTESFTACAAKMQHVRLYQRLSDHYLNYGMPSNASRARDKLSNLRKLELYCYLDDLSFYETLYTDGFISEIMPLAFPKPDSVNVVVRPNRLWSRQVENALLKSVDVVQSKLDDIFAGRWTALKDVPIADPPKKRVPEFEKEPLVKKGILALGD